jgi:hypothetical protein
MRFVRLGMVLLLATAMFAQDKPKEVGYDLAACSPDGQYYGVHIKQNGKDFDVDSITLKEGLVQESEGKYIFEKSEEGIDFYAFKSGEHKLELLLKPSAGRGIFLQDGKPNAILFVGEDADGSKLEKFTGSNVSACEEIMSPAQSSEAPDTKKI